MENYPSLSKSPIKEVVIEFQFQKDIIVSEDLIVKLNELLKDDFTDFKLIYELGVTFNNKLGTNQDNQFKVKGGQFKSSDSNSILNISTDRYSLSSLKPYDNFLDFKKYTLKYWSIINKILDLNNVSRVGIRFINIIELKQDINYYFKNTVQSNLFPSDLENPNSFHTYLLKNKKDTQSNVKIMFDYKNNKMIFDTDTFFEKLYSKDDNQIWDKVLNDLRDMKNNIFFNTFSTEYIEDIK